MEETSSTERSDIKKDFLWLPNSTKLVTHDGTIKLYTLLGPLTCGASFEYLQIPYKLKKMYKSKMYKSSYGYNAKIKEAKNTELSFYRKPTYFYVSKSQSIRNSEQEKNFITIQKDPAQTETYNL